MMKRHEDINIFLREKNMTNLYFIRHAHTALNGMMIFQGGQTDSPLDQIGLDQVSASIKAMNDTLPSEYLLVCSPLMRTKQTAAGLKLNTENVIYDDEIREIDFGEWEGKMLSEVQENHAPEVARYYDDDITMRPDGGESIGEVESRMLKAIAKYSNKNYENVVFVSHGNSISIALSSLLSDNEIFKRTLAIPGNVSVSKVNSDNGYSLDYYNRVFY